MVKGNHCVTIDDNKWEALAGVVNGSRSAWIERQIDIVLNIEDEEAKLLQKIEPTPVTQSRTITANQAKLEEPKTEKLQEMVEKLNPLDNAEEIATSIIAELPTKNLVKAYEELIRLNRNGFITDEECPAIKQEIERLLA